MSLITHRCTICGHPDFWRLCHGDKKHCPDCGHICTAGEPELMATFDLTGQPVERVLKPGERPMGRDIPTCDCAACVALYEQLTGGLVA